MKLEIITKESRFADMEAEWKKLFLNSLESNPYLSWEWINTFWKFFRDGMELYIIRISEDEELIGLFPLRKVKYDLPMGLSYTCIEPTCYYTGKYSLTDYTGLLVKEKPVQMLQNIIEYLNNNKSEWDFFNLYDIPESSLIYRSMSQVNFSNIFYENRYSPCPYLFLDGRDGSFPDNLSKKFRRNLRYYTRRLRSDFSKIEIVDQTYFSRISDAMDVFITLHQKRALNRGLPGVFKDKIVQDFHLAVASEFYKLGWLRLFFLIADDKPISASYNFLYNNCLHKYLTGFDPDFARYSPVNQLDYEIFSMMSQENIANKVDFMKGDEGYKYNWTETQIYNMKSKIINKRLKSNLLFLASRIIN